MLLVLLPGLDGNAFLFGRFINALPESVETLVIDYPREVKQTYDPLLELVRARLPTEQPFRHLVGPVGRGVLALRVRQTLGVDVSRAVKNAKVPMLHLGARDDLLLRSGLANELSALNPAIELVELPGPHLLLQVKPEESAAIIARFATAQSRSL